MSSGFPLTVIVDQPILVKYPQLRSTVASIEAWINFQALKAAWYADETRVLEVQFTLMTTAELIEQLQTLTAVDDFIASDQSFGFSNVGSNCQARAIFSIDLAAGAQTFKSKLIEIANQIAQRHHLPSIGD